MFIIFTPRLPHAKSLICVCPTNPSPVIKSPGNLALNNLKPKLNSTLTVILGLIKQQEYVCLHVRFSCRRCHERHAASGELTRRLPPDPIDSQHPGLSWCTCRVGPRKKEDKKAGGVGARVEDRRNSRQWMISMSGAILMALTTPHLPNSQQKQRPWPWHWPHVMGWWSGSGQRGWSVTGRQGLVYQLSRLTGGAGEEEEPCTQQRSGEKPSYDWEISNVKSPLTIWFSPHRNIFNSDPKEWL